MKRLTIKCVVYIMFGMANKNYVIRPDSNSYLGQQYLTLVLLICFYNLHLCAGFFLCPPTNWLTFTKSVINQSLMDLFISNKVYYNVNNVYYQLQYNR